MSDDTITQSPDVDLLRMTSSIVSAYVSFNSIALTDLEPTIRVIHETLANLQNQSDDEPAGNQKPAVPIKKSVTPDYIICLEDGAKLKMLKRYLRTNYSMTPEEYLQKWNLPADYPMVAPNYAAQRSNIAKKIGLGKNRRED